MCILEYVMGCRWPDRGLLDVSGWHCESCHCRPPAFHVLSVLSSALADGMMSPIPYQTCLQHNTQSIIEHGLDLMPAVGGGWRTMGEDVCVADQILTPARCSAPWSKVQALSGLGLCLRHSWKIYCMQRDADDCLLRFPHQASVRAF